jgi:hypothetical protein
MSNAGKNTPRIPLDIQLAERNRVARIIMYGSPWDSIERIKDMVSNLLEHPPAHLEKKRADIIRKIEQIHALADELIQDMPKSKSRRGAVGIE